MQFLAHIQILGLFVKTGMAHERQTAAKRHPERYDQSSPVASTCHALEGSAMARQFLSVFLPSPLRRQPSPVDSFMFGGRTVTAHVAFVPSMRNQLPTMRVLGLVNGFLCNSDKEIDNVLNTGHRCGDQPKARVLTL